jgi:hypothetical protein
MTPLGLGYRGADLGENPIFGKMTEVAMTTQKLSHP